MKRMFLVLPVLGALILIGYAALAASSPKVTICHATSSDTNPWVRIVVSENAIGGHFDNPVTPKAGHEDDVLLQGEQPCPVDDNPVPEEPTPEEPIEPQPATEATPPSGTPIAPLK